MNVYDSVIVLFLFFILYVFYYGYFFNIDSYQDTRFSGDAEYFVFIGQNSSLQPENSRFYGNQSTIRFKAQSIKFSTNDVVDFTSVKNISINNNTKIFANQSIKIQYKKLIPQELSNNVYIDIKFKNVTFKKGIIDKWIDLTCELDNSYPNNIMINGNNHVTLTKGEFTGLSIWNETREKWDEKNFEQIEFDLDNQSSVMLNSKSIELSGIQASDIQISDSKITYLMLLGSEGTLRLKNHLFNINRADLLEIENILNEGDNHFIVNDRIIMAGNTNSAKLNHNPIILTDFYYWLGYQPVIMSGLITSISLIMSVFIFFFKFIYFPFRNKKLEDIRRQDILREY